MKTTTPMMQQYWHFKQKYNDAILLFRVGDFYETFGKDAILTAKTLNITLTKRNNGSADSELAGFPHHAIDTYLPKLIKAGLRVAVCDQIEDPKQAKGIVKRAVTEVVTAGLSYYEPTLPAQKNNFLAAIYQENACIGLSLLDLSTGDFFVSEGSQSYLEKMLAQFQPSEILYSKSQKNNWLDIFKSYNLYHLDDWCFSLDFAKDKLMQLFQTNSLKGLGIDDLSLATTAAGAILYYLEHTQHLHTKHLQKITRLDAQDFMWMDGFSIKNLELLNANSPAGTSLLQVLDKTLTAMGARLLRRWLVAPLKHKYAIDQRLNLVKVFFTNHDLRNDLRAILTHFSDLERLAAKIASGRISPRELLTLHTHLLAIKTCYVRLSTFDQANYLLQNLLPCDEICHLIERNIHPNAPVLLHKGEVIAPKISVELDELRQLLSEGQQRIQDMQERAIIETGISTLKIAFNNVFGYYIEVRHGSTSKVPASWQRKQTLVQAERYITPELKEYEEKILGAEEKIAAIESQLYFELLGLLIPHITVLQNNAQFIAQLDVLLCFAEIACNNNYVLPVITENLDLTIVGGRHPVIEKQMNLEKSYVPNDTHFDPNLQIMLITGPNMAGKSAYLRQNALIVLMAQMGCFVPAKSALIGCVDKIFTRVGAADNISAGESTFMVEMNETASILNNLSDKSLIILDEIGRGTSTYDGVAIAWSIAAFIHENSKAKTLFATHYHELNQLNEQYPKIHNFHVCVKETPQQIIFLHQVIAGASEHSFGIHVAKMAGIPKNVLDLAKQVLRQLEQKEKQNISFSPFTDSSSHVLFTQLQEELNLLNTHTMSPIEALLTLEKLKNKFSS